MLSIIVCSVNPELVSILKKNIAATIGSCEYEVIDIDNREEKRPIAKVYNEGAGKARYPYLLFAHEDVEFLTQGWGKKIIRKLAEEDCGVIGFAGSTFKPETISGWFPHNDKYIRQNYHDIYRDKIRHIVLNNKSDFEQVITLDGLAQFVRKDVWEKHPYDEDNLTGFHCYDIDFSLQIAQEYKNYVSYNVNILHKSMGTFDEKWLEATIRITRAKWNKMNLSRQVTEEPGPETLKKINEELLWQALKIAAKHNSPHYSYLLKEYRKLPKSLKHLERLFRVFYKYGRPKNS